MSFEADILRFNNMYKLPVATHPSLNHLTVDPVVRLKAFKDILTEELSEIDEIVADLEENDEPVPSDLQILVKIADLLGDIQVYCASEMAKFGLPQGDVLNVIMQSNFSKLGADGLPIYDERGKVQKGPGYWKPEPQIQTLLQLMISDSVAQSRQSNRFAE